VRSASPAPRYAQYDARKTAYRPQAQRLQPAPLGPPKVFLLRGFMNIFSLGMDDLAERIKADGIPATVTNHADADMLVSQIVASYQAGDRGPVILVGHSLGADAVIAMAQALDRSNIPVALLVLFDGTATHEVPGNVARAINFTQRFNLTPGADFRGALSNVDLSHDEGIDHFTIDKSPTLRASVLNYVMQVATSVPMASARRP
jgi:pimeloyl-ACP methyl ester carboxylesterase